MRATDRPLKALRHEGTHLECLWHLSLSCAKQAAGGFTGEGLAPQAGVPYCTWMSGLVSRALSSSHLASELYGSAVPRTNSRGSCSEPKGWSYSMSCRRGSLQARHACDRKCARAAWRMQQVWAPQSRLAHATCCSYLVLMLPVWLLSQRYSYHATATAGCVPNTAAGKADTTRAAQLAARPPHRVARRMARVCRKDQPYH